MKNVNVVLALFLLLAIPATTFGGEADTKAERLLAEGLQRREDGDLQEALHAFQEALDLYRNEGDRGGQAVALKELGNTHQLLGEHRKAIEFQRECLEIAKDLLDPDLQARAHVNLGISLQAMGLNDQAKMHYEQSLSMARQDGNRPVEAIVLFNQASLLMAQGEDQAALAPLESLVVLTSQLKDDAKQIGARVYLGLALSNLQKRPEAVAQYRAALDLLGKIRNPVQEGTVLNALAHEFHRLGDLPQAVAYSRQALAVGRAIEDPEIQKNALRGLALSYLALQDHANLVDTAQQLRELAQRSADSVSEESAVLNLALAYTDLDEEARALQAYRDLLALARKNGNKKNVAASLQALGDAASLNESHDEAIALYRELLVVAREIPDPAREGTTLTSLGVQYEALDRGEDALDAYEQALALAVRIDDKFGQSKALRKRGIARLKRGEVLAGINDLDRGLALNEEVLAEWEKEGVPGVAGASTDMQASFRSMTAALQGIAEIVYGPGGPGEEEALNVRRIVERALSRARRQEDRDSEAKLLATLSDLSLRGGEIERALDLGSQALAIAREARSDQAEAEALRVLALVHTQRGDPDSAIPFEQELLALAVRLDDPKIQAMALSMLAVDHLQKHDLPQASDTARQAQEIAERLQERDLQATASHVLMVASDLRMDSVGTLFWGEKTLNLARELKDRGLEIQALRILGEAHLHRGDHVRAIATCQEGTQVATGPAAVLFLRCLGKGHDALQDFEKAEELLQRALSAVSGTDDPATEATVLDALGSHFFLRGKSEEGAIYFERGARAHARVPDNSLAKASAELSLAVARTLQSRTREAITALESSLELLESSDDPKFAMLRSELQAGVLGLLVSCHVSMNQADKALAYAERRWNIAKSRTSESGRAAALHSLGLSLFRAGRFDAAEQRLREGAAVWEAIYQSLDIADPWAKATALESQNDTYDLLQQVLVEAGRQEAALEVAERSRGRVFAEGAPPTLEAIRRLAREKNVTLVVYSVLHDPAGFLLPGRLRDEQPTSERDLFLWVVKPTGDIAFAQFDLRSLRQRAPGSLAALVRVLRYEIGGRDRGRGVEPLARTEGGGSLRQLSDLLITPIVRHLPLTPEERVVFIPHGPLFLVPFPALTHPSGPALIEQHTILWAPSLKALAAIPGRELRADWKGEDILMVGDPDIAPELTVGPYNLQKLSGARDEATTLAAELQTQALLENNAGKREILQLFPQYRLLHLASHGLLEGFGDPLLPGALVLAPSKDDNGLLTAREIAGLSLRADLAVLSACDTGRGRITSDGVSGLSSALLKAGVPNVVVSLWEVPDEATRALMIRFYRELKANPDPARALRQAMLAVKRESEFSRPRSWAGFTLIGGMR
jgi:CHAT domain-containing protein/tetratricopeptide (TPR) repeat protein